MFDLETGKKYVFLGFLKVSLSFETVQPRRIFGKSAKVFSKTTYLQWITIATVNAIFSVFIFMTMSTISRSKSQK